MLWNVSVTNALKKFPSLHIAYMFVHNIQSWSLFNLCWIICHLTKIDTKIHTKQILNFIINDTETILNVQHRCGSYLLPISYSISTSSTFEANKCCITATCITTSRISILPKVHVAPRADGAAGGIHLSAVRTKYTGLFTVVSATGATEATR